METPILTGVLFWKEGVGVAPEHASRPTKMTKMSIPAERVCLRETLDVFTSLSFIVVGDHTGQNRDRNRGQRWGSLAGLAAVSPGKAAGSGRGLAVFLP